MNRYRNRVTGAIQAVSQSTFLALFDESVQQTVVERLARTDVVGVVCFENPDFGSSQFGQRTAMIYGPGCSSQTMEEIQDRHLGEVPSRFQYPTAYYQKEANANG